MVTEGQTATEEGNEPTQEGAPPTEPQPPTPAAQVPTEEYKGLQRALSAKEREIAELKQQLAAQPQPSLSPGMAQSQADNAYWQMFNAAKARGMDDEAAGIHGNYGRTWYLLQVSQQEVADLQARHQEETRLRDAKLAEDALISEMRGIARDAGVDPDDPLLDYGEDGTTAGARIARLRRSIPQVLLAAGAGNAPPEPAQPPDRSAERVDTSGSTSPPSGEKLTEFQVLQNKLVEGVYLTEKERRRYKELRDQSTG